MGERASDKAILLRYTITWMDEPRIPFRLSLPKANTVQSPSASTVLSLSFEEDKRAASPKELPAVS
jgi:hypothetical protein